MRAKKEQVFCWIKRVIVYLVGLFVIAFGVSIAVKSNLGVSSATSLPYVLSKRFTFLTLGNWTTIIYCVIVLLQLAILRKDFKWYYIFQFAVSTVFGFFVDGASFIASFIIPDVTFYALRLLYTAISLVLIAIGVILYLAPNIMSMPVEGFAQALTAKTKLQFSTSKMIADMSLTALAVVFSLIFWQKLDGIREGTIILAFGTGLVIKPINKLIKNPLHSFLFGKKESAERDCSESEDVVSEDSEQSVNQND